MIGIAYVQGLQAEGVAATVKHFVANDSETDRFSVNALVDERVLRELYLRRSSALSWPVPGRSWRRTTKSTGRR